MPPGLPATRLPSNSRLPAVNIQAACAAMLSNRRALQKSVKIEGFCG
jgi:hypothetical protein